MELPGQAASYWMDIARPEFSPLAGGAKVDVAVIGGGWVGILVADLLKRGGRTVAVLEGRRVAGQVTGRTSAKLTSLHRLIYAQLIRDFDEATARLYGEANQAGIDYVERIAAERGIDCDFARVPAYTYSEKGQDLAAMHQEVEAAGRLGLPASFVAEPPLPFPVAGAVCFENQARFHPLKFLMPIAASIPGDGSQVFEHTRVFDVEPGNPHRVLTDRGTVWARDVIIATNLPFMLQGLHFARVFPQRHALLAARLAPGTLPEGMFISVGEPSFSIRPHPDPRGDLLVTVGPAFKTGQGDTGEALRQLEAFTRERFAVEEVLFRWGNQDYFSPDRIPLVGKLSVTTRRIYVATGFSAWGLANGVAAAQVLSDHVLERANPWSAMYDATRFHLRVTGKALLGENFQVGKGWLKDRVKTWRLKDVCDVSRGEGGVCRHNGVPVAVYKGEDGRNHYLSPFCPHLGCMVGWNSAEKSWDCPCHGSRFTAEGEVIEGPSVRDLERRAED
jgi:glycine/D-amino acid oxidase-like deaminating enzyme/nitrite reductase/ring-hydroxylating ferredoxin subunit